MSGSIKPTPVLMAPAHIMQEARQNCAARATARGEDALAAAYMARTQDQGWAMRHEVERLTKEGFGG